MYFVAPGEKINYFEYDELYIQNKYKQSKFYFDFSTVPAKEDKETKYRKTKEGKQIYTKYSKYTTYRYQRNFTNTEAYPL